MKTVTLEAFKGKKHRARISFATPELLWKVLTAKRWEVLKAMAGQGPLTIRGVARRVGRDVKAVKRSLMTGLVFGPDQAALNRAISKRGTATVEELEQRGIIVGTPGAVIDQIGALIAAGVQGIMLQWLDLDDLDGLEALAKGVLDQV